MKKILIVDDVVDIADILKIVLQKDYEIQLCTDETQVCATVEAFQPALILLDNKMGDVTATEMVKELREKIPGFNIPFIIFTGSIDAAAIAEETGAVGFIEKPSDINYIRQYIAKFI